MTPTAEPQREFSIPARMMSGFLRFQNKWYLTALFLAVVAIAAQLLSLRYAGAAAMLMANAVADGDPLLGNSALALAHQADACGAFGLFLGLAASFCWGASLWYGESRRQSVLFVMLTAWFLLFFVMV
jgi:hypothetical protein